MERCHIRHKRSRRAVLTFRKYQATGRRRDGYRGIHEGHDNPEIMDMRIVVALAAIWAVGRWPQRGRTTNYLFGEGSSRTSQVAVKAGS